MFGLTRKNWIFKCFMKERVGKAGQFLLPGLKRFLQFDFHSGDDACAAGAQTLFVGGLRMHPAAGALGTLRIGNADGEELTAPETVTLTIPEK